MLVSIHDTFLKLRDTALCGINANHLSFGGEAPVKTTTISILINDGKDDLYMYLSTELCSLKRSANWNLDGIVVKLSISLSILLVCLLINLGDLLVPNTGSSSGDVLGGCM